MRHTAIILTLLLSLAASAQKPVYDLVERISKGASRLFLFDITDPQSDVDFFELDQRGPRVWIRGNSNVSIATGLNWYLKYHANIQITWNNPRQVLENLPKVKKPERHTTDMLTRYYFNYCTFSYSMAFWDWRRWEQEIDFMAMHGINLPLALTGTSVVWRNTLIKLGYTPEEATAFIADPAHQAWWLMNNLEGADSKIPESFFKNQETLAKQIVARYREWGIEPVFAGYAGMVPRNAGEKLGLNVQDPGLWCGYPRPAFLQPEDPKFAKIANIYYEESEKLYGKANYYAVDPFHEGGSTKGVDLAAAGRAIYGAIKQANPDAVWVIQSWQAAPYQSMIDQVPAGKVLVLDLFSESRPQWGDPKSTWYRKNGFEQHDWIYCMLLNFGGNTGLFGKMSRLIESYYLARELPRGKHLKGVGATAEGIENNPVMYELLFELPWRTSKFSKDEWLSNWVRARYGRNYPQLDEAWTILSNTAYNPPYESTQEGTSESVICSRPALVVEQTSSWATSRMYYKSEDFEKALELMFSVGDRFRYVNNFLYDLTDVARQAMANRAYDLLPKLLTAFEKGEKAEFKKLSDYFLNLILLEDRLLGTRREFLVGAYIEQARRMAANPSEHSYYREVALRLITTWGNRTAANKGGLRDYSHREWNGLLRDFYYPRWKYFFDQINATGFIPVGVDYFDIEDEWVRGGAQYSAVPLGDTIELVGEVVNFLRNRPFP